MQTAESLSYEAIPSRFCEGGAEQTDYAVISETPTADFSYALGLSPAFASMARFIRRQHMNAIGRLGTSAQSLEQAGGLFGHNQNVVYGAMSAVTEYDGISVVTWISTIDGNTAIPLGENGAGMYTVMDSTDVSDWVPQTLVDWELATPDVSSGFFDA